MNENNSLKRKSDWKTLIFTSLIIALIFWEEPNWASPLTRFVVRFLITLFILYLLEKN